MDTPKWVTDAVFYQIFPDRFARSQRVPKVGLNLEDWDSRPNDSGFQRRRPVRGYRAPGLPRRPWSKCSVLHTGFRIGVQSSIPDIRLSSSRPTAGRKCRRCASCSKPPTSGRSASFWTVCSITPAGVSGNSTTRSRTAPRRPTWIGSTLIRSDWQAADTGARILRSKNGRDSA